MPRRKNENSLEIYPNLVSPFTYSYKCNSQLSNDMTRYQIISRINHQLGGKFPTDV